MQEYMSFIKSMNVLACVGCCLAASTLQFTVEFYRCCGNVRLLSTKQLIHTPTHAHIFIAVAVGPEVILFICLWGVDSEHRQDLTRAVWDRNGCNERHEDNVTRTPHLGMPWEKHTSLDGSVHARIDGDSDESPQQAGNMQGACIVVSWYFDYSDYQIQTWLMVFIVVYF